jgi:hypothetical protein
MGQPTVFKKRDVGAKWRVAVRNVSARQRGNDFSGVLAQLDQRVPGGRLLIADARDARLLRVKIQRDPSILTIAGNAEAIYGEPGVAAAALVCDPRYAVGQQVQGRFRTMKIGD